MCGHHNAYVRNEYEKQNTETSNILRFVFFDICSVIILAGCILQLVSVFVE